MSIREDINDIKKEVEDVKAETNKEPSLAMTILKEFKAQNKRLFIANILLAAALIISIIF